MNKLSQLITDYKFRYLIIILTVGLLLGGALGCTKKAFHQSGFLSDYSNLKPHPTNKGLWIYANPEKNLAKYSQFYVPHVVVIFSDESVKRGVDPTKINELSEYLRNQIIRALEDKYTLTGFGQRQPGTLAIGIAITDLKPAEKNSGGASMEYKLVDYVTEEIVMTGVITQTTSDPSNQSQWTPTRILFQNWAARLRAHLDDVQSN